MKMKRLLYSGDLSLIQGLPEYDKTKEVVVLSNLKDERFVLLNEQFALNFAFVRTRIKINAKFNIFFVLSFQKAFEFMSYSLADDCETGYVHQLDDFIVTNKGYSYLRSNIIGTFDITNQKARILYAPDNSSPVQYLNNQLIYYYPLQKGTYVFEKIEDLHKWLMK